MSRLFSPRRSLRSVRLSATVAAAALAVGAALVTGVGSSNAAPVGERAAAPTYLAPQSGSTRLALAPGTAAVLAENNVSVAPASEARTVSGTIAFPITGGLVNAKSLAGSIKHSGGLTFTVGERSLTVRNFVVSTSAGRLSGYADEAGASIPVLDLDLAKATIRASQNKLAVYSLPATLNATAAAALNDYFDTELFTAGLAIGTVRVDSAIRTLR